MKISTREAFGKRLVQLGAKYPDLVVLDADLAKATTTALFKDALPDRFFDAGISEQDMMGTAAGLAAAGKLPVASTFAVFATGRAFEQVRNSIAYPNLNVKIIATHGGISIGADGGSHQAVEDIALMRVVPNMSVIVPADAVATEWAVEAALRTPGPVYVRLGRHPVPLVHGEKTEFSVGKAVVLRNGCDVMLAAIGEMVYPALRAAEELSRENVSAMVVDFHTVKPLDEEAVLEAAARVKAIITVEDHSVIGGLGSAICEVTAEKHPFPVRRIGIMDRFGQSGEREELFEEYGLTWQNIVRQTKAVLALAG